MTVLFSVLVVCAAAERHTPRPALLQRPESDLLAARNELPDRTYSGRASVFDVFRAMEDEGAKRMGERPLKLLAKSVAAGVCVGLGGILCSGVGGDLAGGNFWDRGAGLDRFIFGAIGYPLSITLVAVTASSAFTGNLALAGAALHAGKCSVADALYMLLITYGGCFIGTVWCGMLSAVCALPGAAASAAIAAHKLELTMVQTFARGIGGGLLISLAILLATTAVRNHGNIGDIFISAFLPISAYVASDFEHVLANFFFFAAGRFSGEGAALTLPKMAANIAASTLGNVVGAGVIGGYLLAWANGPDPWRGEKAVTMRVEEEGGA